MRSSARRLGLQLGLGLGLGIVTALAACGGGDGTDDSPATPDGSASGDAPVGTPDADTRDLLVRLDSLPGVTASEFACRTTFLPAERCFQLAVTQPVDHAVTGGATFQQDVTLASGDLARPMVAYTTGYDNYWYEYPSEPAQLLQANQISLEYRFFGSSRPEPADWTKLTIEQAAADEHHVIELLKSIYQAPWITSGGSKGGMTASYHMRFWPDDVAGTAPYVAPLSFGAADPRYAGFLDSDGTPACRQALRDVEVELLKPARFDAMKARAIANQGSRTFTRIQIGPAVEGGISGIEWAFWQYRGVADCGSVPAVTATDAAMWAFLKDTSNPLDYDDTSLARFEPYYYQTLAELGDVDGGGDYLQGLTRYTAADYDGIFPAGVARPTLRTEAMTDIDQWVQTSGHHMLFVYGEYDPYSAGHYTLGAATDSAELFVPQGTHNDGIANLVPADQTTALAKLAAWTGVTPDPSQLRTLRARRQAPPTVRVPALPRALRLARARLAAER